MMKMTVGLLASLFFIGSVTASFGGQDVSPLTLEESIEIALKKSPTLQAAKEAINEAQFRRRAAISDFLTHVNTLYTYTRFDEAPFLTIPSLGINTQVGTRDVYDWTTTLTQPIFTGGALINNYRLAELGVDTAEVELETTTLDLILQVKETYYGVLKSERFVEVAERAVEHLESQLKVSQAFFEVGLIPKNDLLQVEVEMAQKRQDLITAQNNLEIVRAVFNTLLRRGIDEEVKLVEILHYRPMKIDMAASIEQAYKERPEIKAAELAVKSAEKGVRIAASGFFPQVRILFNYERQGDNPSVNGSRYQPDEDSWNVLAMAEWKIWDWGKTWWGVGENKAKVFQAERALEDIRDKIRLEVKTSYLNVGQAEKNIIVAEKALSQAEENLRINEERYKEQVATSTEVLDALTLLTRGKTNYYAALRDYNIAIARLKRSVGGR
jgi:outer membrane protein